MSVEFEKCFVDVSKSLLDGMHAISNGRVGIALVLDGEGRLYGLLTDGDIRRAILKGASMDSSLKPAVFREFTSTSPEATRTQVLDLMQARLIEHVPIVNEDGRVLGLHLLHEIIGAYERPNWAVIMAGGKGKRLRPITENSPKPMIKVAGRPILERLVLHLVGFGIRRIFISINYLGHVIKEFFGDGRRFGCKIEYLQEKEFLGTGGAISLLSEKPQYPLLVMNGDLVTQVNVDRMLAFHKKGSYTATIGVKRYFHQVPFGCVETIGNQVVGFEEKPMIERLINAGIYVLSPECVSRVENRFFPITELFTDFLECDEAIGSFEIEDGWIDVGQHVQLNQARNGDQDIPA